MHKNSGASIEVTSLRFYQRKRGLITPAVAKYARPPNRRHRLEILKTVTHWRTSEMYNFFRYMLDRLLQALAE